jgi:hypothetical protein
MIDSDKNEKKFIGDSYRNMSNKSLNNQVQIQSKGQIGISKGAFNANNYKTKSDFQKRLMGENNLNKYKSLCIGLLKEDDELKKLCEFCGFLPNYYDVLLGEQFFCDKVFLYKLEILLSSDSNLNKAKKEKFFKEEIKDKLEFLSYDIKYKQNINKMNYAFDNHLIIIQNFDFFK